VVIAYLVNVHNERCPCCMENHRKRDVDMDGSFDEAKHEWPPARLFPCRVVQGERRRADVHSWTNRIHVWVTASLHSSGSVEGSTSIFDRILSREGFSVVSV
jgi:hypothetical protein